MTVGPVERISRVQFFWMVGISVVAGGIYTWPQPMIRNAGTDAPWALGVTIVLAVAMVAGEIQWARRVPGATYFDRLTAVWGRAAWLWFTGTTALCVVVDAAMLALFVQMLGVFFYPDTPAWTMRVLLVGLAGRFAAQSLPVLARNVQFWFPVVLLTFFGLVALSLPHLQSLAQLHPDWPPKMSHLDEGILATWYLWTQGALVITLAPWVRQASWGEIRRWGVAAYLFQGMMLFFTGGVVVGMLGRWAPQILAWPLIYVFVNLGPEAFLVARPGILVLPTWALALVFYLAVRMFFGSVNLQAALGFASARRWWSVLGMVLAVSLLALMFPTPEATTRALIDIIDPLAVAWMLLHTGSTLAVAWLRVRHPSERARFP